MASASGRYVVAFDAPLTGPAPAASGAGAAGATQATTNRLITSNKPMIPNCLFILRIV